MAISSNETEKFALSILKVNGQKCRFCEKGNNNNFIFCMVLNHFLRQSKSPSKFIITDYFILFHCWNDYHHDKIISYEYDFVLEGCNREKYCMRKLIVIPIIFTIWQSKAIDTIWLFVCLSPYLTFSKLCTSMSIRICSQ